MKLVKINIHPDSVEIAIKGLINSVFGDKSISVENCTNLWNMCEQLSQESFVLLKSNVHFSDFLKSFDVYSLPNDRNIKDGITSRTLNEGSLVMDELSNRASSNDNNPELPMINHLTLATRLDDLDLPTKFLKLIKRLRNVELSQASFNLGETIGDIIRLGVSDISTLPGIGKSYVETFEELKLLINSKLVMNLEKTNVPIDFSTVDISNMRLCLIGVEPRFIKALEKYARYIRVEDLSENLRDIVFFEKNKLNLLAGFGPRVVDRLIEFRDLVRKEIESILIGDVNYLDLESTLITPKKFGNFPLKKIESVILDDVEVFLDRIENDEVDIAQMRWGFVEDKQTLEEIGLRFGITRERIRQKESKINSSFLRHLRINQMALWEFIEPILSPGLKVEFQDLFSCFASEKDFYDFLSLICNQENIYDSVFPEVDMSILNTYFAENGAPVHIDDVREYISGVDINLKNNSDNVIHMLAHKGALLVDGNNIWPRQLGKAEATACVLFNHERGLPWLDVARLVNGNGYSKTDVYEDRLDNKAFELPDFIYLAGKGVYKHTRFIDMSYISLDDIIIAVMEYAELDKRDVFHLMECYQSSEYLQKHDYFVIRYFVKHFGEDYGLYFDGRSQSDSVGLKKGFKNITQKDVIIEAMNKRDTPLTKTDVANLLKSKSRAHASFYLDGLIDEGKVVQVDRMLYTTPNLAYKNIKVNDYVAAIDELLKKHLKPVEPSILKMELNACFSVSYSKYFYASIARLYAKRQCWHRKHHLYSVNDILFKSLKEAVQNICRLDSSTNHNVVALQKHIAIADDTASIAISNWKNSLDVDI